MGHCLSTTKEKIKSNYKSLNNELYPDNKYKLIPYKNDKEKRKLLIESYSRYKSFLKPD